MNVYRIQIEQREEGVMYAQDELSVVANHAEEAIVKAKKHAIRDLGFLKSERIEIASLTRTAKDLV